MEDLDLLLLAYALMNVFSPTQQVGYLGAESTYAYRGGHETPPPKGYRPFYINAVARHSESYFKCSKGMRMWLETLRHAKSRHSLLVKGEALETQLVKLVQLHKQGSKNNKVKGHTIQQELATRMYNQYPEVFGRKVFAVATSTDRARESMRVFLEALGEHTSTRMFRATVNPKVDPVLRFFDINKAYGQYQQEGKWKEQLGMYRKRSNCTKEILEQFFEPKYIQGIQYKEALASQLYEIYSNQYDREEAMGIGKYFTDDQLRYYAENKNVTTYLMTGPSNVDEYVPTNMAFGLLGDFLVTTEHAIHQDDVSANLRFAHAETLIPFTALLKLPGYMTQTNDLDEIGHIWQEQFVVPKGANLKWVLYRNDATNDILVKMLYNEKEVPFPIETRYKPYYKWRDVRAYYVRLLKTMGIEWQGDIVEMVRNYTP